jgi:CubicO group peptidase (beta-lactamase class C family)
MVDFVVRSGLLSYDDPVCKYWPELAKDPAKAQLTVAHLLRHEAGLPALPPGVQLTQVQAHPHPHPNCTHASLLPHSAL